MSYNQSMIYQKGAKEDAAQMVGMPMNSFYDISEAAWERVSQIVGVYQRMAEDLFNKNPQHPAFLWIPAEERKNPKMGQIWFSSGTYHTEVSEFLRKLITDVINNEDNT